MKKPSDRRDSQKPSDGRDSQIMEAKDGGTIKNAIQVIIRIGFWGVLVFIVGRILVAGISNISELRELFPTPTPTAFTPATKNETLIIIASFDNRSDGQLVGVDPAQRIYDALNEEIRNRKILSVRIERLPEAVKDINRAREVSTFYNASFVLWGWFDTLGITPHIEILKEDRVIFPTPTPEGQVTVQIVTRPPEIRQTPMSTILIQTVEVLRVEPPNVSSAGTKEVNLDSVRLALQGHVPNQATYLTFLTLGLSAYKDMKDPEAIQLFTVALDSLPDAAAFFYRAQTYAILSDYASAIKDYTQVIAQNPDFVAFAYGGRARAYAKIEDYERAIEDFTWLITNSDPKTSYKLYPERGEAYYHSGEYEKAIQDFTSYIANNPHPEGYITEKTGIEIDVLFIKSYFFRGRAHYALNNCDQAVNDLNVAIEKSLFSGLFDLLYWRGRSYLCLNQVDAALADFSQELQLNGKHYGAYEGRGVVYFHKGYTDKAIIELNRAIEIKSDYGSAYGNRGYVYASIGKYEHAINDYAKAIQYEPSSIKHYNNLGDLYSNLRRYDQAIDYYSRALKVREGYHSYFYRGNVYANLGEYDKAIADYNEVIRLEPNIVNVYYLRGIAYSKKGDKEKATADFNIYMERGKDPDLRKQAEENLRILNENK